LNKNRIYILFVASAFLFTIAEVAITGKLTTMGNFTLLQGLFVSFLAFWWLRFDAQEGHLSGPFIKALAIFFSPLAISIHLFRTRGFKKGIIANLGMLGLLFLFGLSGVLAVSLVNLFTHQKLVA
jgi:hypothetical protein